MLIGGVVEIEPLAAVEDRHRRRQPVKQALVGAVEAILLGLVRFALGKVDRQTYGAAVDFDLVRLERPPLAGDGGVRARAPVRVGDARLLRHAQGGAVKQLGRSVDRLAVFPRDRAQERFAAPLQTAVARARPGGMRQRVEQFSQSLKLRGRLGETFLKPQPLQPVAGNIANAHHRIGADSAAGKFEMAPLQARHRRRETLAARQQLADRLLDASGSLRVQPTAERENAARVHRLRNEAEFALDPRLGIGAVPDDDDLRFGRQELFGALEFSARALQIGDQLALARAMPTPGRRHGEDKQREHDDERGQQDRRQVLVGISAPAADAGVATRTMPSAKRIRVHS